ncbi:hypothetical protein SAI_1943, partial [Streptococcus agalactiae H36B]
MGIGVLASPDSDFWSEVDATLV